MFKSEAPGVADLATAGKWAEEYLAAEAEAMNKGAEWSNQFMEQRVPPAGPMVNHEAWDSNKWAREYLEQNEHKEW